MKKSEFNFLIESLMFLFLSMLAGIGLLMRFSFAARDTSLPYLGEELVLGLADHEWGTIHLYVGLILVSLILTHIYLHFSAIQSMYSKLIENPQKRKILGITYILICLILFFSFFIINIIGN